MRAASPAAVNTLDRFDIDFSLCMYCGICVEVCPFEALFWTPEYEYSEFKIADLLHDKARLGQWIDTVPEFEPYEAGLRGQGQEGAADEGAPRDRRGRRIDGEFTFAVPGEHRVRHRRPSMMIVAAIRVVTTKNIVHAALYLVVVLAGVGINYLLLQAEFVAITQFLVYIGAIVVLFLFGIMLTQAPLGVSDDLDNNQAPARSPILARSCCWRVLGYSLIKTLPDDKLTFNASDGRQLEHRTQISDSIFSPYLIPFEVVSRPAARRAHRRHRPGAEGLSRDAAQPVPPARGRAVLHRRLRRARPHATACSS